MVAQQYQSKTGVSTLCNWLQLSRSIYYYKPGKGKRGRKPSTHTYKHSGEWINNETVVEDIKWVLSGEFVCYGYENIALELKKMDYLINEKKVYRLMDENNLLLGKVIKTSGKREFVKHRKIEATKPMEHLCLDIKYVWVQGEKRNYYLLSIMDVYSRKILEWAFQKSIRKYDVINLFRKINNRYGIKGVFIRNDNGSQFIANDVKQFLKSAEAKQEFTHIATPEENSYIEAFHSIVQREVIERYEFSSGYDAKTTFERYMEWYNVERNHRRLGNTTPAKKWEGAAHKIINQNIQPDFLPSFLITQKAGAEGALKF